DEKVCDYAAALEPSPRGEIEITDLNRIYLAAGNLQVETLGRGFAWLDAGTHDTLLQASNFVQTIEQRQGLLVGSPEEAAYRSGFITASQLHRLADLVKASSYASYLSWIVETA
ncbi:MAG TPA: sugar phosphate nucleotidyltransferase, partial [Anaerolineales bacterium]|nr:sugar phosphate nucleotidyltransferase [Anaerolineales bacterium]